MDEDVINIAITLDGNYVVPVSVLMTSILDNLDSAVEANFFLIVSDFEENHMNAIDELHGMYRFEVTYIRAEDYRHYFNRVNVRLFKNQYINITCYYRLLLFKILPDDVKKCFYIDGDMIVKTDISVLYPLVDDKLAAVVVESVAMELRNEALSHLYEYDEFKKFRKNPQEFPYFNAGFLLLNIERAREYDIWDDAWKFFENHPNPPYADQDILNYAIGQRHRNDVHILPPEYNVFCTNNIDHRVGHVDAYYPQESTIAAYLAPRILHYAGPDKPWVNSNTQYFEEWWKYAKMSVSPEIYIGLAKKICIDLTTELNNANYLTRLIRNENPSRMDLVKSLVYLTLAKSEVVRDKYDEYLVSCPYEGGGTLKDVLHSVKMAFVLLKINMQTKK